MTEGIDVIIASRNGEHTLSRVLAALGTCEQPGCPVRFVLVDNGSEDATRSVMEDFARGRDAQVIVEARHGKSHALNAAIARARGDLLAFLDDDAIPVPGWLKAHRQAMIDHPGAGVFIGQVRPHFMQQPPTWLAQLAERGRSCACTPADMGPGECSPTLAKGLNWAIRRAALGDEKFDEVNNNLLRHSRPVGGQDTEMARRLHRLGHAVRYVPEAVAHHIVRPQEMSARAVFERYRRIGRGAAAQRDRSASHNLLLPAEIAAFAVAGALSWAIGARSFAAANLTRVGSRLGRLEYLLSRSRRSAGAPDPQAIL